MPKNQVHREKNNDKFFKKSRLKLNYPKSQHKSGNNDGYKSNHDSANFFRKPFNVGSTNKPLLKENCTSTVAENKGEKKPFDKKRYRLQKYSNKYKVQQWEEQRKKVILHNYYKTLKNSSYNSSNKISEEANKELSDINDGIGNKKDIKADDGANQGNLSTEDDVSSQNASKMKNKTFRKAHEEYQRIVNEKAKKKELLLQRKKEKEETRQAFKKKKMDKYRRLNKKTKKGQPIMKDHIEMLLEKIQNTLT